MQEKSSFIHDDPHLLADRFGLYSYVKASIQKSIFNIDSGLDSL
jgi:hypothetical protein